MKTGFLLPATDYSLDIPVGGILLLLIELVYFRLGFYNAPKKTL